MAALATVAVLGLGVLAEPRSASPQMYRWTDDTGETHFTVSLRSARPARVRGIGGAVDALAVRVDSIEVDEARLGLDVDGLLGRDFLDNFTITIDSSTAVLVLAPKQAR